MSASHRLQITYRLSIHIMLAALVAEYVLGMYTAFFVAFPDTLADGNAWAWSFAQSPAVAAHAILGTLMAVFSLLSAGLAVAGKDKIAILASIAGLAAVWFAAISGSSFLSNIKEDSYSFSMSLGFLTAIIAYGMAFYALRPTAQKVTLI